MVSKSTRLQSKLHIFKKKEEVSQKLADKITSDLGRLFKNQKSITLCLSGGTTPEPLYEILAGRIEIPWEKIHLFLVDERYVSHNDPNSNILMIKKTFEQAPIPSENIHPIPTQFKDPERAADSYEKELNGFFKGKVRFDITVLGIGEDGHVASLFPGFAEFNEKKHLVVPVFDSPKPPLTRITLTFLALNSSQHIYFLVTGEGKAEVVNKIFTDSSAHLPAQMIDSYAEWWLDQAAARLTT